MFLASSALVLGFLHGLGVDHLMAIAALSIGSSGSAMRVRTFRIAVGFALGHAVLLATGSTLIVIAGWTVPVLVERTGEIAGGCILIVLGVASLWMAITSRVYGHAHSADRGADARRQPAAGFPLWMLRRWHWHLGGRHHHHRSHEHASVPAVLGAAFAVSGFRALTLLMPAGTHTNSFVALIGLILVFALGILLSMSLFGIVLAGVMGVASVTEWAGRTGAAITAAASCALGVYWVFLRG